MREHPSLKNDNSVEKRPSLITNVAGCGSAVAIRLSGVGVVTSGAVGGDRSSVCGGIGLLVRVVHIFSVVVGHDRDDLEKGSIKRLPSDFSDGAGGVDDCALVVVGLVAAVVARVLVGLGVTFGHGVRQNRQVLSRLP